VVRKIFGQSEVSVGKGFSALICKFYVFSDRFNNLDRRGIEKKREFLLTKISFGDFFEIFLSFLRLFFESYFV